MQQMNLVLQCTITIPMLISISPSISTVNSVLHSFLIDSSSSVNIFSLTTLNKMLPIPRMEPYYKNAYAFNSKVPVEVEGTIRATVMSPDTKITVPASFLVMKSINTAIPGNETASELNILHVRLPTTSSINTVTTNTELIQILEKYEDRNPRTW